MPEGFHGAAVASVGYPIMADPSCVTVVAVDTVLILARCEGRDPPIRLTGSGGGLYPDNLGPHPGG
jgi:hypothetical protein